MAGVTFCVPPVAANAIVLWSTLSVITTWVALLAVTLSMDELPCAMVVGLAVIATVGTWEDCVAIAALPPQEASVDIAANAAPISEAVHQKPVPDFSAMPGLRAIGPLQTALVPVRFHAALAKVTKGAPAPATTSRGAASMPQPIEWVAARRLLRES